MQQELKDIIRQYLITAEWTMTDEDHEIENKGFCFSAAKRAVIDCDNLVKAIEKFMPEEEAKELIENDIVGHDFWLTRNHYGAGFWDGDYPKEQGELLTTISHYFKEVDIYIGDDKFIHFQ